MSLFSEQPGGLEQEFETFQRQTLGQPQTFNLSGLLQELQPTKVNL